MKDQFVTRARRSSKHMGGRLSFVAFLEVAASDHMGSTTEGDRSLF